MAILVTGGAGFIGSHACVELLNEGYEIIALDNFSNSSREALRRVSEITGKRFKIYDADLRNKEHMRSIFSTNKIDAVVHFAGLKAVGESVSKPLKYYENNLTGTIHLCEIMQEHRVKCLVFSSSATVYGEAEQMPITEETKLGATNPYGRTKQWMEELLRDISFADPDWSIAILRYFNPVGAHESGLIGEDPVGIPNNLMPYISQVAIGKRKELQIFGNDYPTKDGTGIRDFIHVVDLASGHVKALEKMQDKKGVDAYNLGTGKGYSVLEVIEAFERVSGTAIPYTIAERRLGDVAICYADPSKAKNQLNWQATRGIEAMCRDTWRWQRLNPYGYIRHSEKKVKTDFPTHIAAGFFMPNKADLL